METPNQPHTSSAVQSPVTTTLLTQEQGEKIIAALKERGAESNCARCGNENFELSPGIASFSIQGPQNVGNLIVGGPRLPTAVIVCMRCGAVYFHALGTLGFFGADGNITL